MGTEWKSNALGILGIGISFIALLKETENPFAWLILGGAIAFYIIGTLANDLSEQESKTKRLEEKLKIHEQLITMKSEIEILKKEIRKDAK